MACWLGIPWRRIFLQVMTAVLVTVLAVPLMVYFVLTVVFRFVRSPMSAFWRPAPRDTPPAILQDPQFGEHAYVTLPKGIKLHYVHNGDSKRPLLLLLHGFPEFWYSWKNQLQEFSSDYWVVAVDMRGYGDSDKPSGTSSYRADILVDDIKELLDAFERPSASLVGHGWGGVVGWLFLERYPERVDRLVAIGAPHPVVFQRSLVRNRKQLFRSWYLFLFQVPWLPELLLRSDDLACLSAILRRSRRKPPSVSDDDLEAYKFTFGRPGALTGPINYYRAAGWGIHRRSRRPPRPHGPHDAQATCPSAPVEPQDKVTANGEVAPASANAGQANGDVAKVDEDDGDVQESRASAPNEITEEVADDAAASRNADSTTATWPPSPPVLLLVGGRDAYVQHSTVFRTRKFFPNVSVVVIRDANHFAQLDDPLAVNAAVRKFFES